MYLTEIGREDVDWIQLALDRGQWWYVMKIRGSESWELIG